MLTEYLNWTEEQWDEYEAATVTISLDRLGSFLTACELLRDGRRLKTDEREAWEALIKEIFPLYLGLITKISQKGA